MTDQVTAHPPQIIHDCNLSVDGGGPVRTLHVTGRLDWTNTEWFAQLFHDECTAPGVVIDLSRGEGIDSAGTGILLAAALQAGKRGQQLVLVTTDHTVLELLGRTGLPTVVPIVATEAAALAYLRARGIAELSV